MPCTDLSEVYDEVFAKRSSYNKPRPIYKYIIDFASGLGGKKILDAGCGKGHYLRYLLENGFDTFGIEFSKVCCDRFLSDVPHACIDIESYTDNSYDGVICMDVLEHIPYWNIDNIIEALTGFSKSALYTIANHSDIICDHELHLIQEDAAWWKGVLSIYYSECQLIVNIRNRSFVFECYND